MTLAYSSTVNFFVGAFIMDATAASVVSDRVFEKSHTDVVNCLGFLHAFNDNEDFDLCDVISGSDDKTLKVWGVGTGVCKRTLEGHSAAVTAVCALPVLDNGDGIVRVVSASDDTTLKIWNVDTGVCERTIEGHPVGVRSVNICAVCHHGVQLISGGKDYAIRIWNATDGECEQTLSCDSGGTWTVSSSSSLRGHFIRLILSYENAIKVLKWTAPLRL